MPHTPGYQPVEYASNVQSKITFKSFKSIDLVKNESARLSHSLFGAVSHRKGCVCRLESIAMILVTWDFGLEIFKKNAKSIKSWK